MYYKIYNAYLTHVFSYVVCLERRNDVCIISEADSTAALLLVDSLSNHVSTVKRVVNIADSERCRTDDKQTTFNTVVLFHVHEIQDQHLVDFAAMLDIDRQVSFLLHVFLK